MAFTTVLMTLTACFYGANGNIFSMLMGNQPPPMYGSNFVNSLASQVPGSNQNTISGGPMGGSNLPPPETPRVLTEALRPPPGAAQPLNNFLNMVSPPQSHQGQGHGQGHGQGQGHHSPRFIPVTGKMKVMVDKWATQLGHKAYYEAHGCVDPTTTLMGKHAQMATFAMMLGCNNYQAKETCEMAQLAHGGRQGARMRMLMEIMMPKETKHMMEQCLTPTTMMHGMTSMMGGMAPHNTQPTPPQGAASASGHQADCSGVSHMLMMGPGAAEGMMSPEHMEQIGILRNRYLQMECQENMLMGSLPYRLCCPGNVRPPTMQEAMMMKSMRGSA